MQLYVGGVQYVDFCKDGYLVKFSVKFIFQVVYERQMLVFSNIYIFCFDGDDVYFLVIDNSFCFYWIGSSNWCFFVIVNGQIKGMQFLQFVWYISQVEVDLDGLYMVCFGGYFIIIFFQFYLKGRSFKVFQCQLVIFFFNGLLDIVQLFNFFFGSCEFVFYDVYSLMQGVIFSY